MSMNLIFEVVGVDACVDFPFQTSTNLTYAVLKEPNLEKRLKLVKSDIDTWIGWSKKEKADMYKKCEKLMRSPKLKLSLI